MKTKLSGKQILSILLSVLMVLSITMMTAVAEVTYKLSISDQALWESAGDSLHTAANELGLTNSGGVLTFDPDGFMSKTDKEQKQIVKNFMNAIVAAGLSAEGTNVVMDALNSTDKIDMSLYLLPYIFDETKGDLIGGMGVISPFMSVINIIIGAGAILVTLGLVLFTVYDLVIIVVPFFRNLVTSKNEGSGNGKPAGVSVEAWHAICAAENGDGKEYKSALWVYFKHRLPAYIVLGIVLAYLVFGGFGTLMQSLLSIGNSYVS